MRNLLRQLEEAKGGDFDPVMLGLVDETGRVITWKLADIVKQMKRRSDIEAMARWVEVQKDAVGIMDRRHDDLFDAGCQLASMLGRKETSCAIRSKSVTASKAALKNAPPEILKAAQEVEDNIYDMFIRHADTEIKMARDMTASGYRRSPDVFYTMADIVGNLRDNYGLEKKMENKIIHLDLPWEEKSALMKVFSSQRSARIVWDRLIKSGRFETCIGSGRRKGSEARGLCLKDEA